MYVVFVKDYKINSKTQIFVRFATQTLNWKISAYLISTLLLANCLASASEERWTTKNGHWKRNNELHWFNINYFQSLHHKNDMTTAFNPVYNKYVHMHPHFI